LILGRFFSVRQDSAMLPLLLIFTAFGTMCGTACYHTELPDIGRFALIAPLSSGFERRRLPGWNVLAGKIKPPKIGMFQEKAGAFL
jgi:hypothetical protein